MKVSIERGALKGKSLTVDEATTRPTQSRVKESLFNILMWELEESRFIDLFGGSGQIAVEAIAMGAHQGYYVEMNPRALRPLSDLVQRYALPIELLCMDAFEALELLERRRVQIDWLFADPPYAWWSDEKLSQLLTKAAALECRCVVIECSSKMVRRDPLVGHVFNESDLQVRAFTSIECCDDLKRVTQPNVDEDPFRPSPLAARQATWQSDYQLKRCHRYGDTTLIRFIRTIDS